ncbi:16S rRNA (guanine(527)-N(7))-methyltransferase RsmG [Terriglobus aquaticus]|uniref:Ribosomal RNA small subunit methyltransferase G n=1 Tax=Terriglobus aquaticus TaxID=940139 RepID=A0ABW9KF05_9BACT|nr:16S rRNA (guanine(527)-N(7))-methyltransferase RsmG [Terriglobus aquaticus]
MAKLDPAEIGVLLQPYLAEEPSRSLCERVQRYLALLEVWNKKLNLTSVREAAQMVERHMGESFYMARLLPEFQTMLDLGSGAGFPGLPISLMRPEADVMLAEAHAKKAVFLREAVWMTGSHARVWAHRVEEMERDYRFDVVTLRAVDNMPDALALAMDRLEPGGTLAFFTAQGGETRLPEAQWAHVATHNVPRSGGRILIATLAQ